MLEVFPLGLIYNILKDISKYLTKWYKKSNPAEILNIRNKWQAEVESKLREFRKQGLSKDVIIRDIDRLDDYPNTSDKKGISPWFRSGLMDTYHRGILLGLNWIYLIEDTKTGKWREVDPAIEEGIKMCLAGKVPYENIASINWDGDDYYNMPHIFCHFNRKKGQPYEDIVCCQGFEVDYIPGMPTYTHYSEVVAWKDVKKLT